MDNLYRELAPISAAAWADLEEEVRRTFRRHVAGRRLVDVAEPAGETFAALGTGHREPVAGPADGVRAEVRQASVVVELRVPFTVDRRQVDSVERGAKDADWQPAKDAARQIAFAEDQVIFEGYPAAGIAGLRTSASLAPVPLPEDPDDYPDAVSRALAALRLAGVGGPYALALGADAYKLADEGADDGYPVRKHLSAIVDGDIVWAPAIEGGFVLSTRGGDYELALGQDLAIGYLSHDEGNVELYLQETLTFLAYTSEAVVALPAAA
ncbi:family 1 encapsulin nanocompartment shell protein [Hamadaea tsunoensis]|uniref:family 1 encapsulin nanocompartment shell protein n=1 Tax=Hamadaea tsunoensis TaxID=53368 RepID=UPI0003FE30A2|nr:family 1 encapsulin nanocompartment shell protein [Hamadaea tsunoensis]